MDFSMVNFYHSGMDNEDQKISLAEKK